MIRILSHFRSHRSVFALAARMGLIGMALGLPLQATQPGASAFSVTVPSSVRIRSRAAADYDPSRELVLQGRVEAIEFGVMRLRLPAGLVKVELGAQAVSGLLPLGSQVAVVASLRILEGRQHLVARELSWQGQSWTLRDAQGVPVP